LQTVAKVVLSARFCCFFLR